jgi:hypothetical protein
VKLYIIEAFPPHIVIHELDQAIRRWSGATDPAGALYLEVLQRARASGQAQVIEDAPGDTLNVAEIFVLEDWPRIVDDFYLRRFLGDPAGGMMVDILPDELRAGLE